MAKLISVKTSTENELLESLLRKAIVKRFKITFPKLYRGVDYYKKIQYLEAQNLRYKMNGVKCKQLISELKKCKFEFRKASKKNEELVNQYNNRINLLMANFKENFPNWKEDLYEELILV